MILVCYCCCLCLIIVAKNIFFYQISKEKLPRHDGKIFSADHLLLSFINCRMKNWNFIRNVISIEDVKEEG